MVIGYLFYGEKFSEGECQNSNVLLVHSSFTLDDITPKKYEYDVVFSLQRHSSGLGLKELFFTSMKRVIMLFPMSNDFALKSRKMLLLTESGQKVFHFALQSIFFIIN